MADVDYLTDLPINFQKIMGVDDTVEEDDLLDAPSLKKQNKVCRKQQARNIHNLAEQVKRDMQDFGDKLKLASINCIVEGTKRDSAHRKSFVNEKFTGNASLVIFIDDLYCKLMARAEWQS